MKLLKLFSALAVAAASLSAQATQNNAPMPSAGISDLQQMKQEIADLESKLAAINQKIASAQQQPVAAVPLAPEPIVEQEPEHRSHSLEAVTFHGVSDVNFGRPMFEKLSPGGLPSSTNSFGIGDLDLYTSMNLTDHLDFFAELLITSDFTNEFAAELDRMMLTYKLNDHLKITVGKFNNAIGYYSNAFHRARYFQTTAGRPLMFADEDNGGILPVHGMGLSATGLVPSGKLNLHWVAEITNGRNYNASEVPVLNFVDTNNGKALNFGVFLRPEFLPGIELGTGLYREKIYTAGLPRITQTINSVYAVYVTPRIEFLNEAAIVNNTRLGAGETRSFTGYTQFSRKLGNWRPYARYDYQNSSAADPLFGANGRSNGPSAGLRYQIGEFAAAKVQYGRLSSRTLPTAGEIQLQIAFAF